MKNRIWKRIASCVLAGTMIMGLLAGCGSTSSDSGSDSASTSSSTAETASSDSSTDSEEETTAAEESTGITYPLEGDNKLTYGVVETAAIVAAAEDVAHTPFGQAWQEATGVELEIVQWSNNEALGLLLASGDLPDILFFRVSTSYTGGATKAMSDNIIIPLNDYMEYAPDLQALFDENDEWRKACVTADGSIIGFPNVRGDEYLQTSQGLIIRDDWLEELGLDMPQTPDELYEVLKAFRDEKGATAPWTLTTGMLLSYCLGQGMLTSPFGLVKGNFYQVDGTVHWGFTEPEYKDVLEWLHMLYEEGLLDANIQTVDSNTVNANIMNGTSGVTEGFVGSGIGTYMATMAETDPDYSVTGFGPLVANDGDTPMSTYYDNAIYGYYAMITSSCEDVELAMKFLNYGYTEEGNMLFNFGIEGESYTMVDGYPTYTDWIMNNPDGLSKQYAMAYYMLSWNNGPFVQRKEYMEQYSNLPQQTQALDSWTNSDVATYSMPEVTIAEEDSSEYSTLYNDAYTYISEMSIRYITGMDSLDTFESEYLATLESLQVDRIIELQQAALDEYNSR